MALKKVDSKLATPQQPTTWQHDYSQMDCTSSMKRRPPITPIKPPGPPLKIKAGQEYTVKSEEAILAAIEKLTSKIDDFGSQLRENTVMVANISRLVETNAAEIKDCKAKITTMEKEMPRIIKENQDMKEKVADLEIHRRRWNLKIDSLKVKEGENTREVVVEIPSKIAHIGPTQWTRWWTLFIGWGGRRTDDIARSSCSSSCGATEMLSGRIPRTARSARTWGSASRRISAKQTVKLERPCGRRWSGPGPKGRMLTTDDTWVTSTGPGSP